MVWVMRAGATGDEFAGSVSETEGMGKVIRSVRVGAVVLAAAAIWVVPQRLHRWNRAVAGWNRPVVVEVVLEWFSVGSVRLSARLHVWLWCRVPVLVFVGVGLGAQSETRFERDVLGAAVSAGPMD